MDSTCGDSISDIGESADRVDDIFEANDVADATGEDGLQPTVCAAVRTQAAFGAKEKRCFYSGNDVLQRVVSATNA